MQLLYQAGPGVAPMVLPLPGGNTSGTPLHLPGALTSDEFMQWAAPRMFQDSQVCGSHPPPSLLGSGVHAHQEDDRSAWSPAQSPALEQPP